MKILLDLGDLDTLADDDEVLSAIRNAVEGNHELESHILHIPSVTAKIIDSSDHKVPRRSFRTWLARQADRNDVIGDLARDVRGEADAPKGRVSRYGWLGYLRARNACREATEAFREAWSEFELEANAR